MYSVKPFCENVQVEATSTTMYSCKSYYHDQEQPTAQPTLQSQSTQQQQQQQQNTNVSLTEISHQQQSQLRRLERLRDKLNQFCDDLNLNHLITTTVQQPTTVAAPSSASTPIAPVLSVKRVTTKTNKSKTSVDDLVIHFDATTGLPYSLFILFNQLTLKYKTFVQFYLHGSLNKQENTTTTTTKLQSLIDVFNKLNLTLDKEPRSSYDYGLTFIAKQMNHNQAEKQLGPVLTLPQTNKKTYGQVNIFRYLQRLLLQNEKQSKQEQLLDTLVLNDCLDKCTNQLSENKNNYLNNLNKTFSSSKYLLGDKLTLADYYVWSQLKQFNLLTSSSSQASLNEWSKRVESSDQFIQLLL